MAQTPDAISFKDVLIELSTDNFSASNVDASGYSNKVEVGGGERAYGEFFTADGDTPILTVGKRSSFELTMNVVYTEGAGHPFEMTMSAYENATGFYMRWSPKGGGSGDWLFTSGVGYILSPVYPGGDASTPDVVTIEFTLRTLSLTKSVIA